MKSILGLLFIGVWMAITVPFSLIFGFRMLRSIVFVDKSGISMIVITIILVLFNFYVGTKIYGKLLRPLLEKGMKK